MTRIRIGVASPAARGALARAGVVQSTTRFPTGRPRRRGRAGSRPRCDGLLRPRADRAPGSRRGPRHHRAVRLDTVVPPGFKARSTTRQHRHRLPGRRTARRRAAGHADPDARHRRRPLGMPRRWPVSSSGCPTPRSSASPRTSAPGLRQGRQRAGRVRLHADVHGRHAQDRQGRHLAPRRRHPRRRHHPPQRPVPRRHPLARRGDHDPDLPRRGARRLRRRLGPADRQRRRVSRASWSTSWTLVRRHHLPRREDPGEGRPAGSLLEHILDNTRTPTYNKGDIEAMIAACELAKRRYARLIERYGSARSATRPRLDRLLGADAPPGDRQGPRRRLRDRGRLAGRRRPQPRQEATDQGRRSRSRATRSPTTSPDRATRFPPATTALSRARRSRRSPSSRG